MEVTEIIHRLSSTLIGVPQRRKRVYPAFELLSDPLFATGLLSYLHSSRMAAG